MVNGDAPRVLVLGASGMLGAALLPYLSERGWQVSGCSRTGPGLRADMANAEAAFALLDQCDPALIVNLIAMTDVDRCEAEPGRAYLMNVRPLENVAAWINRRKDARYLVQISTDQVYDGAGPHAEDYIKLSNYYAFSKYAAEQVALSVGGAVLRTNFFGRSTCAGRRSLSDWLADNLRKGEAITVFDDVFFSPLSIASLCRLIERVLERSPTGVFNLGSHGGMSKADFAEHFARRRGFPTRLLTRAPVACSTALKAYRPGDMRLDCAKFEHEMAMRLPNLMDEIDSVAKDYDEIT